MDDSAPFRFGDEIVSVDRLPPGSVQPYSLATLQEVKGNPNFGPAGSIAEVSIQRAGKPLIIRTRRVMRTQDVQHAAISEPLVGIKVLRMLTLDSALLPEQQLRHLWSKVTPSRGIVIDLRNCVGGDPNVSNFIAGGLIGEHKRLFTEIPRPGTQHPETTEYSDSGVELYRGKVVVLTNTNTESEPEVIAAICKEYGCARLLGEHTAAPSMDGRQLFRFRITSHDLRSRTLAGFRPRETAMRDVGSLPTKRLAARLKIMLPAPIAYLSGQSRCCGSTSSARWNRAHAAQYSRFCYRTRQKYWSGGRPGLGCSETGVLMSSRLV